MTVTEQHWTILAMFSQCYISNLDSLSNANVASGTTHVFCLIDWQKPVIPIADLLLKILRRKSAFRDIITRSVKSTRTKNMKFDQHCQTDNELMKNII